VRDEELLLELQGGLGWPLGDLITINGPALLVLFGVVKPPAAAAAVPVAIQAEVDGIARHGVPAAELERTKAKMLSDFYSGLEPLIERADLLAIRQAFTGDASSINRVPERVLAVRAADVRRIARTLLCEANRATIERRPAQEGGQS
jgi:predicted Zn-dependent peptidase